jgi:hypothetical protein
MTFPFPSGGPLAPSWGLHGSALSDHQPVWLRPNSTTPVRGWWPLAYATCRRRSTPWLGAGAYNEQLVSVEQDGSSARAAPLPHGTYKSSTLL